MRTTEIENFNKSAVHHLEALIGEIRRQIGWHEVQIADLRTLEIDLRKKTESIIPKPDPFAVAADDDNVKYIANKFKAASRGDAEETEADRPQSEAAE